jgi:ABC-type phosphate transport system permease subunit
MPNAAVAAARETTVSTIATGRSKERSPASLVFLVALWFSLFVGILVLVALIVDTLVTGSPRFDSALITRYDSTLFPERTGFRAGILGTIWLMVTTILLAVPLGIAAALYLEEFADQKRWYNRFIEVNLQNLAAVPSIVYGLLAVGVMATLGFQASSARASSSVAPSPWPC